MSKSLEEYDGKQFGFQNLLSRSSIDLDLARTLRERTLQYVHPHTPTKMKSIAQDSLEYIKVITHYRFFVSPLNRPCSVPC
jgi:hypothetical protein